MKAEGTVKQEQIVDAAIKRFSHFGMNKTTITEIAEDLAISKPALFYYFHDKNSLITAVAVKILNEFLAGFEARLQSAKTIEEGLLSLVEVKRDYFKKYSLLAMQSDTLDIQKNTSTTAAVFYEARKKCAILLAKMLEKGVEEKVLKPMDTKKISIILLETLSAFEYCMKNRKSVPDSLDIDESFNKQKEVLEILLNGLKRSEWKR